MHRALELARRSLGSVSPNPAVGAVVVRRGKVVGEGHTQPPGGDHAEVIALRKAEDLALGAELFITLEPCSRHGRTPPCTDAITAAGISRVHVGAVDPNPAEDGRGLSRLREAGIEVVLVSDRSESLAASRLIGAYRKHSTTGMPFVTSKFAMSLDGKIADRAGRSRWITGELARARAHELRAESDAILVGIGTVIADDPRLTARDTAGRPRRLQPLRVVVDSRGRIPLDTAVASDKGRTLIACIDMDESKRSELAARGVEVEVLPGHHGRVNLDALLRLLGGRGVTSILVEGGGQVAGSFFDGGLVDRVAAFIAPMIVGGRCAPGPVAGDGVADITDSLQLGDYSCEKIGDDLFVVGYPE